jgi:spore germination protein KC
MMLSSCWNHKDIEMVAIAAGLAIDRDEKTNLIIATIEIIDLQSGGEKGAITSMLVEAEGETVFDAIRNAIMKIGEKVFWGHCKILIVSEDIAREGIISVIDFTERDAETRSDLWIVISRSRTAKDILAASIESNEIIAFHLDETLRSDKHVSKFASGDFSELIRTLKVKTASSLIPTVTTMGSNEEMFIEVSGTGVLKDDKLVYILNENESKITLLIRNQLKGGLLILSEKPPNGGKVNITLEIFNSKTKLKPVIQENKIYFYIDIKLDVGIGEIDGRENYIEKDKREKVAKHMGEIIENQIIDLVKKTQVNDSTDIFDFGSAIQRRMPKYWKEIESNWDEMYQIIEVIPNVEINITRSALSFETIKVGD